MCNWIPFCKFFHARDLYCFAHAQVNFIIFLIRISAWFFLWRFELQLSQITSLEYQYAAFKIDIMMLKKNLTAIRVSETWVCWGFGPGLNSTFLGNFIWCVYSAFYLIDIVASPLLFICFNKTCNKAILNSNQQCISLIFYPRSFLTSGILVCWRRPWCGELDFQDTGVFL